MSISMEKTVSHKLKKKECSMAKSAISGCKCGIKNDQTDKHTKKLILDLNIGIKFKAMVKRVQFHDC